MTFAVGRKGEIEIMPKFCIHEQHAGICVKTGSYCSEGVCLYEDMRDLIIADDTPMVRCQDCVYARPLKDMNYDYLCHYQAWRKAPAFRHGDTAALKEY